ncbi:MAG: COX15/CtaA family protein [Pseudomonadota bacterium]|nr:COX15/CtaA family protein [Pseudomonadota bacterium]
MASTELYNLSPALRLMVMGLAVALGPLAWVWVRHKQAPLAGRLQALTLLTLFLTFDLVVFGAFTRLSDSGLGCPDWPGCYGSASPLGAQSHIQAAQSAMPGGPVTPSKAWIEMIHRYLATGVGVLILTLTLMTWLACRHQKAGSSTRMACRKCLLSPWWPTLSLLWVCLQGAFGALTVTMKLFPLIVTLHLLGGLVLLALLRAQSVRYAQLLGQARTTVLSTGIRRFAIAAFALLWLQIALGGWVSTNYAVLACSDFPACQNSLWPPMDFSQGFTLWRELGAGTGGANISLAALTAIHYAHRLAAYGVAGALLLLAAGLHRRPAFRPQARWLAGLTVLQIATGLGNVVLGWPLAAALMHTGGAAALVLVLTGIVFSSRSVPELVRASSFTSSRLSA